VEFRIIVHRTAASLLLRFFAVAGTPPASDSRTIRTICSSVNLDFFMAPRFRGGQPLRFQMDRKSTGRSGRFNVNFLMRGAPHRSEDRELSVYQNCLAALSWDGFSAQQTREERRRRVAWFSPKAFFAKFPIALLNDDGFETEAGAPLNDYTEDFEKVSARLKAEVHYCCEQCGSDLSHPSLRRYLHAHHVSARRYDNRRENLKVLCVECHARQPAHGHMAKFPDIEGYRAARSALAGC
jgi:hypothetical protein